MLLPRGRCYPLILCEWQMLLHSFVADVIPLTVCCNTLCWLMLLPNGRWNSHLLFVVCYKADVNALWQMEWPPNFYLLLLCVVMADVIAQCQMEWPL